MAPRKLKNLIVANDPAQTAELHSSHYLAEFNQLDEAGRGDSPRAQKMFDLGQRWLDEANRLRGWN